MSTMNHKIYKKNEIITVKISDLGCDFEGVGKIDNYVFFVPGALPGEIVKAKVLKANKNFAFAKMEQIELSSPYRKKTRCKYAQKCGGCQCMHMQESSVLDQKSKSIANTLSKKIQNFDKSMVGKTVSKGVSEDGQESYAYRNKVQLPIGVDKTGRTVVGFFREHSNDIVPIDHCMVSHNSRQAIASIKEYVKQSGDLPYFGNTEGGNLRHIVVRCVGDNILVTLVCKNKKPKDEKLWVRILKNYFDQAKNLVAYI
ncbi:MAG: TRAM domain-containing protein, partial [Firmicutes bacterium]|nr:TRAM domain-containing protein [Bacillota bacterium]